MIETTAIMPVSTPVKVKISADADGKVSLGIRINGGNDCLLDADLTLPKPGKSKLYTRFVGELV